MTASSGSDTGRRARRLLTAGKAGGQRLATSLVIQNLFWNYAGLIWLSVLSIVSVSLYVRILGSHQWGLISACVSLQIIFSLLDLGFSQITPRWFVGDQGNNSTSGSYFKLFQRAYSALGLVGFILLQAAAGPLTTRWFNVPPADQPVLEVAIRLAAFQFLFQFMNGLNNAVWSGQQRQRLMNLRTCAFTTLRHIMALLVLTFVVRDVRVYCGIFMVVTAIEWWTNHRRVRQSFADSADEVSRADALKAFREVAVLAVGVLVGTAVTQVDRVILSRALPVQEFGIYTLVLTLAMAMLQLQTPVTRSFFPRIVADIRSWGVVSRRNWAALLGLTVLCISVPAVVLGAAAYPVLLMWLGNEQMAEIGAPVLSVLCIGIVLNAIYGCIYQLMLAMGRGKLVLKFNGISLVGVILLTLMWPGEYTLMFGGIVWILVGSIQIICGSIWYLSSARRKSAAKEQSS